MRVYIICLSQQLVVRCELGGLPICALTIEVPVAVFIWPEGFLSLFFPCFLLVRGRPGTTITSSLQNSRLCSHPACLSCSPRTWHNLSPPRFVLIRHIETGHKPVRTASSQGEENINICHGHFLFNSNTKLWFGCRILLSVFALPPCQESEIR